MPFSIRQQCRHFSFSVLHVLHLSLRYGECQHYAALREAELWRALGMVQQGGGGTFRQVGAGFGVHPTVPARWTPFLPTFSSLKSKLIKLFPQETCLLV